MKMKSLIGLTLIAILGFGCQSVEPKPSDFLTSKDVTAVSNPSDVISETLKKSDFVRFVSRCGKMYGMDSDACLEFLPGEKVDLAEFGYVPMNYGGTYAVSSDGTITLRLKDYSGKWPSMKMFSSKGQYYLMPVSGRDGLIMGGRGGAVETSDMSPFFPFKMVSKVR